MFFFEPGILYDGQTPERQANLSLDGLNSSLLGYSQVTSATFNAKAYLKPTLVHDIIYSDDPVPKQKDIKSF
jgi:hypothetical protein